MSEFFSSKTFKFFEDLEKNNSKEWFLSHKNFYNEHVKEPFQYLVDDIDQALHQELPGINITPRSISRPMRPAHKVSPDAKLVKNFIAISISQKRSSLYEWNPGFYIQLGKKNTQNILFAGLWMISSRQRKRLRYHLVEDFQSFQAILKDKKLKKAWGQLEGEQYQRFPKGYDPEIKENQYLWYKQIYLYKNFSRSEAKSKDFSKKVIKDFTAALPFLNWIRSSVGTYPRKRMEEVY